MKRAVLIPRGQPHQPPEAPGEPALVHGWEHLLFDTLEPMVMDVGFKWSDTRPGTCNVREGRPFTFADLLPGMRKLLDAAHGTGQHWSWEPHGAGHALYVGRDRNMHGLNVVSAANADAFDVNGAAVRALIEAAINAIVLAEEA